MPEGPARAARSRRWWGAVAQLGERLVRNEEVSGSIPLSSTKPSGSSGRRAQGEQLTVAASIAARLINAFWPPALQETGTRSALIPASVSTASECQAGSGQAHRLSLKPSGKASAARPRRSREARKGATTKNCLRIALRPPAKGRWPSKTNIERMIRHPMRSRRVAWWSKRAGNMLMMI